MVASKPQFRSLFSTPVCVHFHPVAQEANAELRPLIQDQIAIGGNSDPVEGWHTLPDFEVWSGVQGQTLFRMLRDLADALTAARGGQKVALDWKIRARAAVREKGHYLKPASHPDAFWSGLYFVDDGYHKSDDETLGGEYEMVDPRSALLPHTNSAYGYRIPGAPIAGVSEIIRPQTGMIILHPSWLSCCERPHGGEGKRITIEFDMLLP